MTTQFLNFFKFDENQILKKYGTELTKLNWSKADFQIMEASGLKYQTFTDNKNLLFYVDKINRQTKQDYYPTFLKIIDVLGLTDTPFDTMLEKYFLGNPSFENCID